MKLKNLLNRIPRPVKAIFCAVCVVLLSICYYIALGCPTLSFRQEFRRAEKINLVGPSTIVDSMKREYEEFDRLIVGETDYGICFFGRYYNSHPYDDPFAEKQYLFTYVKKNGDLTICAAPNIWGLHWSFTEFERSLPVYLFTEESKAIRAELEITVAGTYTHHYSTGQSEERSYEQTFQAEATRSDTGIFRFWFSADDQAGLAALSYLSSATGGSCYDMGGKLLTAAFPARVRLYDESGNLVLEKELVIGNATT